jgi:hypothetical protein
VAVDGGGNVFLAGGTDTSGGVGDMYLAKYAAVDGSLLWEQRYSNPGSGEEAATTLAVGAGGVVALSGYSGRAPGNYLHHDLVTVLYRETLPAVAVEKVQSGIRLRFSGEAGASYQVQRAPAPNGPWSTNVTLTALTNGPLEYIDTNGPPGSAFYRTSAGP